MIYRDLTSEIITALKHFPVVGIIGPHQVGKTTLSKYLSTKIEKPCLYLDLEYHDDIVKLEEPSLFLSGHADKCIILDEIQRMPHLFPLLRAMIDKQREPARFIILGSASPDLISKTSETLAGRIAFTELTPFCFSEIHKSHKMHTLWIRGGFPEPFLLEDGHLRTMWYENFIKTYVERELPMLGAAYNPALYGRFVRMLAHVHGKIWNASDLSKSLGVSVPTVRNYIYFLENSFLIHLLPSFHFNSKKRLVKAPKFYFRDSGLLHHIHKVSSFDELNNHSILGFSWEGFVIEQVRRQIKPQEELFYYRTHRGTECDMVLTRTGKPVALVEIKNSSAPKTDIGFRIAIEDLETEQNFIIAHVSDDYSASDNIRVCNLETFLSKYLPEL